MNRRFRFSDYPSVIVIFAIEVICFAFLAPNFLTFGNVTNVFIQATIPCLLVIGVATVIVSGGMDLSVGSVLSLSGCLSGLALKAGYPLVVAALVGIMIGTACGSLNGLLISKMNLPPFIVTIAMMNIAMGLSNTFSQKKPVYWDSNDALNFIGKGTIGGLPSYIIIGALIILAVISIFYQTNLRTYTYVLGGNEEVLHLSGVSIAKWKIIIYALSGTLAGISGILMNARVSCADPTAGTGLEFTAVVGAVIGGNVQKSGRGSLFGALLGAFTLSVMRNGLSVMQIQTHWQMVITGAVLIVGMLIYEIAVIQDNRIRLKKAGNIR